MLSCADALSAQSASVNAAKPANRFGFTAGINSATFAGENLNNESGHTGFRIGGLLVFPMTPNFAIQPELIYTMKGSEEDAGGGSTAAFKQNYVEVPLLGRYEFTTTSQFKPLFYVGPSVSYSVSCGISGVSPGTSDLSCDDLAQQGGGHFYKVDLGLVLGGGVAFEAAGHLFSVTARYDHGFNKIEKQSSVYNRVMSLVGTMEFPFGK